MEVARQHGSGGVVEAALRHGHGAAEFLVGAGAAGVLVNLVFMILNLVPIPPLDGGRILTSVLPSRADRKSQTGSTALLIGCRPAPP